MTEEEKYEVLEKIGMAVLVSSPTASDAHLLQVMGPLASFEKSGENLTVMYVSYTLHGVTN